MQAKNEKMNKIRADHLLMITYAAFFNLIVGIQKYFKLISVAVSHSA